MLACVPAGAAVLLLTARLLRAPELTELWSAVRKRPVNRTKDKTEDTS